MLSFIIAHDGSSTSRVNLATPPTDIGGQDEEIDQIIEELIINDGPFTKEEYNKAKCSITEGKACGEDTIPP